MGRKVVGEGMVLSRFRWWTERILSQCRILTYLAAHDNAYLNAGCGNNLLPGWLNGDIRPHRGAVYLDFSRPLRIPSNRFNFVFSEHMVEHLYPDALIQFLNECHRILKEGGVLRIATPDLDFFIGLVASSNRRAEALTYLEWLKTRLDTLSLPVEIAAINAIFYEHGHRNLLNFRALSKLVEDSGFSEIRTEMPCTSRVPELRGLEGHGRVIGEDVNRFETFVLEAVKK